MPKTATLNVKLKVGGYECLTEKRGFECLNYKRWL